MSAPSAPAQLPPPPSEFDTKGEFRWSIFLLIVGLHLGALAVLITRILPWLVPRSWPGLIRLFTVNPLTTLAAMFTNKLFVVSLVCLAGPILGVTLGYHRGETHEAFKWDKLYQLPVRLFFLCLGLMGIQGDPITWAKRHLPHHRYTDRPADSHSPMRFTRINRRRVVIPSVKGIMWAHIVTYFYDHLLPPPPWAGKNPRTAKNRWKAWDTTQEERHQFWVGHLEADPVLRVMRRLFAPLTVLRFVIPFVLCGWNGLLIAGVFTSVLMWNITWCTNSVAHMWGAYLNDAKSRQIAGTSRNVFWWLLLWILSLGESWHHFHHLLENCAAHGWRWFQFDLTKYVIWLLERLGLVYDVKWLRDRRANILARSQLVWRRVPPAEEAEAALPCERRVPPGASSFTEMHYFYVSIGTCSHSRPTQFGRGNQQMPCIQLVLPNGKVKHLGQPSDPAITITFLSWWYVLRTLVNTSMGFGDGYMRGKIRISRSDLHSLVHTQAPRNNLLRFVRWVLYYRPPAWKWLQRAFIHHHYDLGNWYYGLWLDQATRSYSCARFDSDGCTLEQAQLNKIDNLLRLKLRLRRHHPGQRRQRLLDIGCGWGYLAVQAAKEFGTQVVGITLSDEQLKFARALADREGVAHLVEFELLNYQDLAEKIEQGELELFDAVVSVGMFEHVGRGRRRQFRFFRAVNSVLVDGGVLVLHTIIKEDPDPLDPWVVRRIFPGGNLPTEEQIIRGLKRFGLYKVDGENLFHHYARTLQIWIERHDRHRQDIISGFDALGQNGRQIFDMRTLWLVGSEAAFAIGDLGLLQLIAHKGKPRLEQMPWVRDSIRD